MGKSWFIPGNVPSSKNGKRWTGKHLISSKAVMKYRAKTKSIFEKYRSEFLEEISKYEKPVIISFTYIRSSKRKFDYINPCQTTQDDMVTHGWLQDDNCDEIIPLFKEYQVDSKNPGVIIEIISEETFKNEESTRSSESSDQDVAD